MTISVILLAGGTGTRMGREVPKQFLKLAGKMIVHYSLEWFLALQETSEIAVVCHPDYRGYFDSYQDPRLVFAMPGKLRQDSVWNGLKALKTQDGLVCIHDAARPLIDNALIQRVLEAARAYGAATVGMPLKFTLKQATKDGFVDKTLDRSLLWEIQTPQVIRYDLLHKGFAKAFQDHYEVTDDVSLVEHLGLPVKLVKGDERNLKITTPEDLTIAEQYIELQAAGRV